MTEPGRLRSIGAVLAVLILAFGTVTAWQVSERASSADAVVHRSQPLSADAARIYRSLADADATAAGGFLAGAKEPREVRVRYERDIRTASTRLAKAAANTGGSAAGREQITRLGERLPVYTGLVEAARANNRQGLPLGGAYLRYANDTMARELLPAARELYDIESARLDQDYTEAKAGPWAAVAIGVAALGALGWAQWRHRVRTNRVFNQGLLVATGCCTAMMLWLAVAHGMARAGLNESNDRGAASLRVLNQARIDTLRARGAENLTLVARGADVVTEGPDQGRDAYEVLFQEQLDELVGGSGRAEGPAAPDSLLGRAAALADDEAGRTPVAEALRGVREWQQRHRTARETDDKGDYDKALKTVIGKEGSTGESFDRVDTALSRALAHEQREFRSAADDGRAAFTGLAVGAGVLAVLGAAGAVLGIGRRLAEYR
ncbi:hypothetical protein [Streptomyces palmae]|uniref:hypothetical protein n=1 Tax=Streptomyces palmae TaxID=1701085 RepID=UPI003158648C